MSNELQKFQAAARDSSTCSVWLSLRESRSPNAAQYKDASWAGLSSVLKWSDDESQHTEYVMQDPGKYFNEPPPQATGSPTCVAMDLCAPSSAAKLGLYSCADKKAFLWARQQMFAAPRMKVGATCLRINFCVKASCRTPG